METQTTKLSEMVKGAAMNSFQSRKYLKQEHQQHRKQHRQLTLKLFKWNFPRPGITIKQLKKKLETTEILSHP